MNNIPTSRAPLIGSGFTFLTLLALAACSDGGLASEKSKDSGTVADGASAGPANVVISAAARTPRTTTWSVNYWQ